MFVKSRPAGRFTLLTIATFCTVTRTTSGKEQFLLAQPLFESCNCSGGPAPLNDSIPNVLIISDSIGSDTTGYFTNVVQMLGWSESSVTGGGLVGNAQVQHSGAGWTAMKGYCGTSFGVVQCAEAWLNNTSFINGSQAFWDVIHFNWGLHDIAAKMYAPVTIQQYEEHMLFLYSELKKHLKPVTGSMIFATTTPVPSSYANRNNSDVIIINNIAKSLFGPGSKHSDVVLHDLYDETVARCHRAGLTGYPETQDCDFLQNRGVHYSDAGKEFTGILTASAVLAVL